MLKTFVSVLAVVVVFMIGWTVIEIILANGGGRAHQPATVHTVERVPVTP